MQNRLTRHQQKHTVVIKPFFYTSYHYTTARCDDKVIAIINFKWKDKSMHYFCVRCNALFIRIVLYVCTCVYIQNSRLINKHNMYTSRVLYGSCFWFSYVCYREGGVMYDFVVPVYSPKVYPILATSHGIYVIPSHLRAVDANITCQGICMGLVWMSFSYLRRLLIHIVCFIYRYYHWDMTDHVILTSVRFRLRYVDTCCDAIETKHPWVLEKQAAP